MTKKNAAIVKFMKTIAISTDRVFTVTALHHWDPATVSFALTNAFLEAHQPCKHAAWDPMHGIDASTVTMGFYLGVSPSTIQAGAPPSYHFLMRTLRNKPSSSMVKGYPHYCGNPPSNGPKAQNGQHKIAICAVFFKGLTIDHTMEVGFHHRVSSH